MNSKIKYIYLVVLVVLLGVIGCSSIKNYEQNLLLVQPDLSKGYSSDLYMNSKYIEQLIVSTCPGDGGTCSGPDKCQYPNCPYQT